MAGFDLKRFVRKSVDQVIPFDNRSWSNQPAPRRAAQPASTARPMQQVGPRINIGPVQQPRLNQQARVAPAPRVRPVSVAAPRPLNVGNRQVMPNANLRSGRKDLTPIPRQNRALELAQAPALSATRVGTGLLQFGSGTYDAIGKSKGTNRFSKRMKEQAEILDFAAQQAGVSGQYKAGNVALELATTGGVYGLGRQIAAKGAQLAPKTANVVSKANQAVNSKVQNVTRPLINGTVSKVPKSVQRATGEAIRFGAKPGNIAAENAFSGYQLAKEVSQGDDITKQRVLTELAINNLAIPGVVGAAKGMVVPAAKATSKLITNAPQTASDIITNKPYRNVSDDELTGISNVRQAMQGYKSNMDVTDADTAALAAVQQRLGLDQNDSTALDEIIGARRSYDVQQANKKPLFTPLNEGGYVKRPSRGIRGTAAAKAKAMLDEPKTKSFFKDETEIDQTNRILKNEDTVAGGRKIADYYREAKGEDWRVEQMSPDEYLRQAAKAMGMKTDQEIADWASKPMGNPAKYAADMKKGDKFPMPWLNEALGSQEGRTRALAAKLNGADTIPVAVARKYDRNAAKPADPLATLKAEASKYKNADEFIKAQGVGLYHRSPNKFNEFDISKVSNDSNKQRYGWGLNFSDSIPDNQYGENLYEARLSKNALIDLQKPVEQGVVSKIVDAVEKNDKNPSELVEFSYNGWLFYKTLSRILGSDKDASLFLSNNGIAGLKHSIGKNANDYILFNDSSIKTKQQLTDLYNQAKQASKKSIAQKFGDKVQDVKDTMNGTKPMDDSQRGFAKNPFGRKDAKDITKGLSKEQSEFINDYAEMLEQASPAGDLLGRVKKAGGISTSAYNDLPLAVKNNNGRSADYVAREMGFDSEDDLIEALNNQATGKSKADWFEEAREAIEGGRIDPDATEFYKSIQGAAAKSQPQAKPAVQEQAQKIVGSSADNNTTAMNGSDLSTKPTKQLSGEAVPALTPKLLEKASSANSTPIVGTRLSKPVDTKDYLKSMTKQQKEAQKGTSNLKATGSDFKEKFIDDLAPIEDRLNKAIKAGVSLNPKDHITYQLDRSRRAEGIMNAYVRDNKLDKIIQNVKNTDEFDQYLIARHAKELDEAITTGRDAAKDAELVKVFDGKYAEQAKELYKYNQKLLDKASEYGLISKESAASLKQKYPEYVPFNRIFNEEEMANLAGGTGRGDASIGSQSVVKKIKGSERAIASPLNSIIDKTRVVIEQGERNKAASMLAGYKDLPGNPFNLKEIKATENIAGRPVISFLDKGTKRTFLTDKVIADAAKNMSRQDIGLWGRIAAIPARALRGGATAANVGFAGANIVKDMVGAAINSKHPVRIADPEVFGKAVIAAFNHESKAYQELMREGVSGTSFDMFRNPLKSNVGEIRSQKNLATRAAYIAKNPGQIYRGIENTIGRSEDFGRALQYYSNKKGYLADGKNLADAKLLAGDQARSNSTNFFRHGSVGKGVNLAIPYWNAGVQGARVQTNRIKQRPAATLGKIGVAIIAPSAMIALNNYSDETKREVMDNIPDYEKKGNIIIVGPNARYNKDTNKWDGVYKFPVPPQHIGIHNTVQDAVKAAKTGGSFDIAKNLGLISENYTTINPTSPKEIANRYLPQAAKLVAEPLTNTNMYTGNKIVPDSQKNLPAKDQTNDYTSGTAKTLGKLLNLSPRQLDNSLRTGFGGGGQNIIRATDSALAATGVIKKEEVQGKGLGESVTGRFYGPNAISPGDKADKEFAKLKKDIVASNEYKKASAYDKGRMLNRLEKDLNEVQYRQADAKNQTGQYAPDFTGKEKKLTKKQQELASSGFKKENYTNLDAKTSATVKVASGVSAHSKKVLDQYAKLDATTRNRKIQNEPDYEWKVEKSQLENDKASGKLSGPQLVKREKAVKKLEVGKPYSKETRQLYGLSKQEVYDYVTKAKNGNKLAEEIVAYDKALYEAGLVKYASFQNSIAPVGKGGRKSSRSSGGGSRSSGGSRRSGGGSAGSSDATNKAIAQSFIASMAAINRTTTSSDKRLRDIVNKKRITRKARVA